MKLAIFDFDGTIFPKETIPFLISCWNKFGYSKLKLYKLYIKIFPLIIKYRYPILTNKDKEYLKTKFMYRFVDIFKGMNREEIDNYFLKVEKEANQYYNNDVIKQLEKIKNKDYEVVLLSGAFVELLKHVNNNLEFDKVIGTTIITDKENNVNEMSVLSGTKKLKALLDNYDKKNIDWDNSYAYADSIDDFKILSSVGHPFAVAPDEKLRKIAVEKGWQIID